MLITEIQDLGGMGYLVFAGLMIFLQAAPRPDALPAALAAPPARTILLHRLLKQKMSDLSQSMN